MDPRKKRIYIGIIGFCLIATVAVVLWGGGVSIDSGGESDIAVIPPTDTDQPVTVPRQSPDGSYSAPSVFPANTKLDVTVLNSSAFKTLRPYQPPTIGPTELGRDNPFQNY